MRVIDSSCGRLLSPTLHGSGTGNKMLYLPNTTGGCCDVMEESVAASSAWMYSSGGGGKKRKQQQRVHVVLRPARCATYEARWVDAEAEVGGFTAVGFVKEGICSVCVFQMTLGQSQDRSPAFAMLPAHKKNSVVQ